MEKTIIEEILEVTYTKVTPTVVMGIKRQLDSAEDSHECATQICDYLGIEYRFNRSEVKTVLAKHDYPNHLTH